MRNLQDEVHGGDVGGEPEGRSVDESRVAEAVRLIEAGPRPADRARGVVSLGQLRSRRDLVLKSAASKSIPIRAAAARALGDFAEESDYARLERLLGDGEPAVRAAACLGFRAAGFVQADALVAALVVDAEEEPSVRAAALLAAVGLRSLEDAPNGTAERAFEDMVLAAADDLVDRADAPPRRVVQAVGELGSRPAQLWLEAELASALVFGCEEATAKALIGAFRRAGNSKRAIRLLVAAVVHLPGARTAAAKLIGQRGYEEGRKALEATLQDPKVSLVCAALESLCRLGVRSSSAAIEIAAIDWLRSPAPVLDLLSKSSLRALATDGPESLRAPALERLDVADHLSAIEVAADLLAGSEGELRRVCVEILNTDETAGPPGSVLAEVTRRCLDVDLVDIDHVLAGPGWGDPRALELLCDADDCDATLHALIRHAGGALPDVALVCASCGTARPLSYFSETTVATVVVALTAQRAQRRIPLDDDMERLGREPIGRVRPVLAPRRRPGTGGLPSDLRRVATVPGNQQKKRKVDSSQASGKARATVFGPPRVPVCDACSQPIALTGKCGCS